MNITESTVLLEKISYTQLLLHSISEKQFDSFVSENQLELNSFQTHSYLLNVLHQLNDNKILHPEHLNAVCDFCNLERTSFEKLIRVLTNRATGNHIALTLSEARNTIQSLLFLIKNNKVNMDTLADFGKILIVVQSIGMREA